MVDFIFSDGTRFDTNDGDYYHLRIRNVQEVCMPWRPLGSDISRTMTCDAFWPMCLVPCIYW